MNAFVLLKNRDYRNYWSSQAINHMGTWMQITTLTWLVLNLTASAERLGLILAMQFLPALILSIPSGVIADRYSKRNILLLTQSGMMATILVMAVMQFEDLIRYEHLMFFALIYGCLNALSNPVRQAFNVEIAGASNSAGSIPLNSLSVNMSRLLGPSVAALVIAECGVAWGFAINAMFFTPILIFLMSLPNRKIPSIGTTSLIEQALEGLAYTSRTRSARNILLITLWLCVFSINMQALAPIYSRLVLHLGAEGYGLMLSSVGAGAIIGALLQGSRGRPMPIMILWAGGLLGLVYVLLMAKLSAAWVAFLLAMAGFAVVTILNNANSSLQFIAPDRLRGRVMSIYTLVVLGSNVFGSYLTGWAFEQFGGRIACGLLGGITFLGIFVFAFIDWPDLTDEKHY